MKISMIGCGKLGLPVALSIESKGHDIIGYDINQIVSEYIKMKKIPYREEGAEDLLYHSKMRMVSLSEAVDHGDIIFVPIQTPHHNRYEGITRFPAERVDFDYSYLISGMKSLSNEIVKQGKEKVVAIISTVLPGTIEREIKPIIAPMVKLVYCPQFIAMGTTVKDFLQPEFTLLGVDDQDAAVKAEEFFKSIHNNPIFKTTIKNAEAIKVAYNTFISTKIAMINTWMEICEKIGADIDELSRAFSLAGERLISMKYLYGGAEDGGGCHPRDNIALSYLSRKLNLSYDWFDSVISAREKHIEWLAKEMCFYNLPKVILGHSFKKESNIIVGSPSVLLKNILEEFGHEVRIYDPHVDHYEWGLFLNRAKENPAVYLISTQHHEFKNICNFVHEDSVILDIWRYTKKGPNVRYIGTGS